MADVTFQWRGFNDEQLANYVGHSVSGSLPSPQITVVVDVPDGELQLYEEGMREQKFEKI